jgi:LacI family transcriptional regulator
MITACCKALRPTRQRIAGISRRGLRQAFCEHVGCTTGDKIRVVRIDHAKRLLLESEEKIESVALRSGYPSLSSIFLAFRKAEKTTPAGFRKIARRGR